MAIPVVFPNAAGRPKTVDAVLADGSFCVHFVSGRGWRITRTADGRYLADFPTVEGAAFVLGALSRGIPAPDALRTLIASQGGSVPE